MKKVNLATRITKHVESCCEKVPATLGIEILKLLQEKDNKERKDSKNIDEVLTHLFTEMWQEEPCEGSALPNNRNPMWVYHHGQWLKAYVG